MGKFKIKGVTLLPILVSVGVAIYESITEQMNDNKIQEMDERIRMLENKGGNNSEN